MVVTVLGQGIKLTPTKKKEMLIEVIEMTYQTGGFNRELVGHPLSWYDWNKVAALYDTLRKDLREQGSSYFSGLLDQTIGEIEF
jgi:hypothetical protein